MKLARAHSTARLATLFFSLILLLLESGCAVRRTHSDLAEAGKQVQMEFDLWLAKPEVQKTISEQKLGGNYIYTMVIDHRGLVQTVYADDNAETINMTRQNEMTRLLRTFTSTIRLGPNERVRFQPKFKV